MQKKKEPEFDISKSLLKEFKREAKRRGQKLGAYIDDLLLALTCAKPEIWEKL